MKNPYSPCELRECVVDINAQMKNKERELVVEEEYYAREQREGMRIFMQKHTKRSSTLRHAGRIVEEKLVISMVSKELEAC